MRSVDRVLLAVLGMDGFIVGLLSVTFLNAHLGATPVPVTALVGGLANGLLLWLAARYTASPARMLPLAGWVIALGVGLLAGPGGDVLLYSDWRTLLLVVVGVAVPVALSWSGRLPRPEGGDDRRAGAPITGARGDGA